MKNNPVKKLEIQTWKLLRQQYINKLTNYLSSGYTFIPHDRNILMSCENKIALLENREPLSFDDIKNKILKNLKKL